MKTIGVLTSGGDAPGMNAALRAVVRTAIYNKIKVIGIERGYEGLAGNDTIEMDLRSVSGIINRGGTMLKTFRSNQLKTVQGMKNSIATLKKNKIEGLVIIGGDGSFAGSLALYKKHKIPIVGIPATIDNDVAGTDMTIGFDTAVNTALDAIDKIRDTATSHERIFIIEVMGRKRGFIALEVGLAGGAECVVLVPEIKYDIAKIAEDISEAKKSGKTSFIIVMAEGAGSSFGIARYLEKEIGCEVKVSVIGYTQRGGSPTCRSRMLASRFGNSAVEVLNKMKNSDRPRFVGIKNEQIISCEMSNILDQEKKIDKDLYKLAHVLAI